MKKIARGLFYRTPRGARKLYRGTRTLFSHRILARRLNFARTRSDFGVRSNSTDRPLRTTDLWEISRRWQPTKTGHNYLWAYWKHLSPIRETARVVVEIGVQSNKSVNMWREFFPNATIWGFDIDPACAALAEDGIKIVIGDQSQLDDLKKLVKETGPIDVVIDDGSHLPNHQLKTLEFLYPHLTRWGIYAIEDTGGVVGDYGLKTILRVSRLIQEINYWPVSFSPPEWPSIIEFEDQVSWEAKHTYGISFYPRLIILERGKNPDSNS